MNKIKVTLINPPITPEERYGKVVKEAGGKQAPLGLCYLAAVLRKNDIDVSIIDAEAENLINDEIIERMGDCDIVGITSTTVAFHRALGLARDIQINNQGQIKVVLGGPHVTAYPKETMKHACFDVGVIGEGEYTLLEIVQGVPYKEIKGVIYHSGAQLTLTQPRPYIHNLDELPRPAIDLLPHLNLYNPPPANYIKKPVLSMISSRGCNGRCLVGDTLINTVD